MEGWVKIFRKMRDWEWYKNSNTKDMFIHLLLSANNEDKMWHGILVKRGQLATSLSSLASDLGMSIQNVRTSIANLKSTHEITSESTNKLTIITVCRFEDYQESQQTDQHADQHATQQQTNNKHEEKNIQLCNDYVKKLNLYKTNKTAIDCLLRNYNWKFKDLSNFKCSYKWSELYREKLSIKNNYISLISLHIHGLAGSVVISQNPQINNLTSRTIATSLMMTFSRYLWAHFNCPPTEQELDYLIGLTSKIGTL